MFPVCACPVWDRQIFIENGFQSSVYGSLTIIYIIHSLCNGLFCLICFILPFCMLLSVPVHTTGLSAIISVETCMMGETVYALCKNG